MSEEQIHLGQPITTEDHVVQLHLQNLMERGHTILPDASEPHGELLLTTCDIETIRRCVRQSMRKAP